LPCRNKKGCHSIVLIYIMFRWREALTKVPGESDLRAKLLMNTAESGRSWCRFTSTNFAPAMPVCLCFSFISWCYFEASQIVYCKLCLMNTMKDVSLNACYFYIWSVSAKASNELAKWSHVSSVFALIIFSTKRLWSFL